jgi:hypothetical protein
MTIDDCDTAKCVTGVTVGSVRAVTMEDQHHKRFRLQFMRHTFILHRCRPVVCVFYCYNFCFIVVL